MRAQGDWHEGSYPRTKPRGGGQHFPDSRGEGEKRAARLKGVEWVGYAYWGLGTETVLLFF